MSNNLYGNSDKTLNDLQKSQERLNKLSIEYNPLNQIKRDLGVVTKLDEIDQENARTLLEIKRLTDKFGEKRRVVEAASLYDYCLGHDYCLLTINEYKSDLPEKSLQAIEEFIRENDINLSQNRDNFFILAPRKYFYDDNMDVSNVAFNIYYTDEYTRQPDMRDKLIEVYGSNFKRSLFSPFREMRTLSSTQDRLYFESKLIISGIFLFLMSAICLIATFNDFNIKEGVIVFVGTVIGILFILIWREYRRVFKDRQYIYRLVSANKAMKQKDFEIS